MRNKGADALRQKYTTTDQTSSSIGAVHVPLTTSLLIALGSVTYSKCSIWVRYCANAFILSVIRRRYSVTIYSFIAAAEALLTSATHLFGIVSLYNISYTSEFRKTRHVPHIVPSINTFNKCVYYFGVFLIQNLQKNDTQAFLKHFTDRVLLFLNHHCMNIDRINNTMHRVSVSVRSTFRVR